MMESRISLLVFVSLNAWVAAARVVSLMWSQHSLAPRSEQSFSLLLSRSLNFAALWDGGGGCVDTGLGVVPDVIKFLGMEGNLGDDQGVVGVTVSTVKCTG